VEIIAVLHLQNQCQLAGVHSMSFRSVELLLQYLSIIQVLLSSVISAPIYSSIRRIHMYTCATCTLVVDGYMSRINFYFRHSQPQPSKLLSLIGLALQMERLLQQMNFWLPVRRIDCTKHDSGKSCSDLKFHKVVAHVVLSCFPSALISVGSTCTSCLGRLTPECGIGAGAAHCAQGWL